MATLKNLIRRVSDKNKRNSFQKTIDRGSLIAVCDYEASYIPGDAVWNEGYAVWWHLINVHLLKEPIQCRGSVGMWRLPNDLSKTLSRTVDSSGEQ